MKGSFRLTMNALHVWTGLIAGWLLYCIFVTGTASYFRAEISDWMERSPHSGVTRLGEPAFAVAATALQARAPDALVWNIEPADARHRAIHISWRNPGDKSFQHAHLDPATGEEQRARDTRGGDFLYRFHYELQLPSPWGRYLAGIVALMMLVAIVSGVVTHQRIFSDFFTFRPHKAPQRAWLDAHNLLGVLSLPFHITIAYTGLVMLMVNYMPWGIAVAYQKDRAAYAAEVQAKPPLPKPSGVAAPLVALQPVAAAALQTWGAGDIARMTVHAPGDAQARIEVARAGAGVARDQAWLLFDGITGTAVTASPPPAAVFTVHNTLYGLHLARFAELPLRWLFFLWGASGCAMVASGLVLWLVKRSEPGAKRRFGHRLVEVLNVGTIVGLPLAIAAYLLANRLIPDGVDARSAWEIRCFFGAWLISLLHSALRSYPRAWREQLPTTAALYIAAAVASCWLRPVPGFDITLAAIGALCLFAAHQLRRRIPSRGTGL